MKWITKLLNKYFTKQEEKCSSHCEHDVDVIEDDDVIPDEYICGLMYWIKDDGSLYITFVCDEDKEASLATLTHQLNTGNLYPDTIQFINNAYLNDDNGDAAVRFLQHLHKLLPQNESSRPVVRPSKVFGHKEEE